ncbi:MAG: cytochrome b/b6 domain-containing protein [Candidatus Obscuribacterales bacterium]|nr:cytochrome b/b6 domain-containing protein [Steroidobacteraceae bacterium]
MRLKRKSPGWAKRASAVTISIALKKISSVLSSASTARPQRVRIWDIPTRLVHWLLVALVVFSWWSAENHYMEYHRYSGYVMLGALLFRVYWGLVGSSTARFSYFVRGPQTTWQYLRSKSAASSIGHNPLGALSVITLLVLLLGQIALGLFAVDIDGIESGPLSYLVSFETGRVVAELHEWSFNGLLVFITLHVAAVLFYLLIKHNNLIGPMITGMADATKITSANTEIKFASLWWAVPGAIMAALIVWTIA